MASVHPGVGGCGEGSGTIVVHSKGRGLCVPRDDELVEKLVFGDAVGPGVGLAADVLKAEVLVGAAGDLIGLAVTDQDASELRVGAHPVEARFVEQTRETATAIFGLD